MKPVAICIVTQDDYALVRLSIENLISTASFVNGRLYIYDNGTTDKRIYDFCKKMCEDYNDNIELSLIRSEEKVNKYFAYNELFKNALSKSKEEYICVFPIDIFVNDNWCSDLIHYYEIIPKSGIVCIKESANKLAITSLLKDDSSDKEDMKYINVFCGHEYFPMNSVFILSVEKLKVVGGFNKNMFGSTYEEEEMSGRYYMNGYNNYYIPNQNCIKVDEIEAKNKLLEPLYNETIKQMILNKTYKVQL